MIGPNNIKERDNAGSHVPVFSTSKSFRKDQRQTQTVQWNMWTSDSLSSPEGSFGRFSVRRLHALLSTLFPSSSDKEGAGQTDLAFSRFFGADGALCVEPLNLKQVREGRVCPLPEGTIALSYQVQPSL